MAKFVFGVFRYADLSVLGDYKLRKAIIPTEVYLTAFLNTFPSKYIAVFLFVRSFVFLTVFAAAAAVAGAAAPADETVNRRPPRGGGGHKN